MDVFPVNWDSVPEVMNKEQFFRICHISKSTADLLGIKGTVAEGADADLLLFDQDLTLDTYVARGKIFMKHGEVIRKGTYEK